MRTRSLIIKRRQLILSMRHPCRLKWKVEAPLTYSKEPIPSIVFTDSYSACLVGVRWPSLHFQARSAMRAYTASPALIFTSACATSREKAFVTGSRISSNTAIVAAFCMAKTYHNQLGDARTFWFLDTSCACDALGGVGSAGAPPDLPQLGSARLRRAVTVCP